MRKTLIAATIAICVPLAACADPNPEPNIEDVAEIGDMAQIKYPASTNLCQSREDTGMFYVAGELALRDLRLDGSEWTEVKAEIATRKAMMRDTSSCRWAPSSGSVRYIVQQKEITGTETDVFHDVNHRIKPVGDKTDDWWLINTYGRTSPFEHVEHPTKQANMPKLARDSAPQAAPAEDHAPTPKENPAAVAADEYPGLTASPREAEDISSALFRELLAYLVSGWIDPGVRTALLVVIVFVWILIQVFHRKS